MSGNFRNNLQAAVLYDGHDPIFPSFALNDFRMAMLKKNIPLAIVQENASGVLMMGPYDLQVTCTFFDKPADQKVFSQTLSSPITQILMPDAQERVARHRTHVLLEVQQGVFGGVEDNREIANFFENIGVPRSGRDLDSFNRRVEVLATACLFLQKQKAASALHWTQSNSLFPGDRLDAFLSDTGPGLLTIHPFIFGGRETLEYKERPVELYTIGAADYIGREIHTDLAPVPWIDIYSSIIAFVKMATMPNGYIIPDGDTWGIDSREFSWRVTHPDGKNQSTVNGEPFFNLKLLYHHGHGYTAPDFTGRELVKGGIPEASALLQGPDQTVREQIDDWKKTEDMARRAGGGFEIYKTNDPASGPVGMSAPPKTPFSSVAKRFTSVFGKMKT